MDPRLERIVRNEELIRRVNEAIEEVSEGLEERSWPTEGGEVEFHCECGQEGCDARLGLTIADFERVHAERDRFVVAPGHETSVIERIVERHEGWVVVDKLPGAEEILDDPRKRPLR